MSAAAPKRVASLARSVAEDGEYPPPEPAPSPPLGGEEGGGGGGAPRVWAWVKIPSLPRICPCRTPPSPRPSPPKGGEGAEAPCSTARACRPPAANPPRKPRTLAPADF